MTPAPSDARIRFDRRADGSADRRPPLPGGPYLVVGLARSGAAAAQMLRDHGEVIGCDAGDPSEARELEGVEVRLACDGVDLLDRAATVVKSPGVPPSAPAIVAAARLGVPVIGELELAWHLLPNTFIGVTGTNGKTTTCELLAAIYREAGIAVTVAGNVGTPLSSLVSAGVRNEVIVCECSSFQLDDAVAFAPECGVLLNVEADHLDRHGEIEAYRAAKLRLFSKQRAGDVAVAPPGFGVGGGGDRISFGSEDSTLARRGGELVWRAEPLAGVAEVRLRGEHNLCNAMAAAAAALALGVDAEAVRAALRSFAGLPHRLEEIGKSGGVLFVNDSKATNVAAASAGIESFEGGVHAILGGRAKGGGFEALRDAVGSRCRACYLIGEAAEALVHDLEGTVPLRRCGDLDAAVAAAAEAATDGDVVLLAPACASFDQYADFEARGDHFREIATRLGAR